LRFSLSAKSNQIPSLFNKNQQGKLTEPFDKIAEPMSVRKT
jgi:hypothetical protein